MKRFISLITVVMVSITAQMSLAFTLSISGDQGAVGEKVQSTSCQQSGETSFTSAAGGTYYTDEEAYSGGKSLELNIKTGHTGFGQLGGILNFPDCAALGGRRVVKGEEIWLRLRLKYPVGFKYNVNGRNKFLRLRTFHYEGASKISEGYNDLYMDAPPGTGPHTYSPYQFIFEGAPQWFRMGSAEHFFTPDEWGTVEYYIKLDYKKGSEGGEATVRVWYNGELIGETFERNTLQQADSFIEALYLFTYWDNDGALYDQKFWVDDLILTNVTPSQVDANGNPFIGMGVPISSPKSPDSLQIQVK